MASDHVPADACHITFITRQADVSMMVWPVWGLTKVPIFCRQTRQGSRHESRASLSAHAVRALWSAREVRWRPGASAEARQARLWYALPGVVPAYSVKGA